MALFSLVMSLRDPDAEKRDPDAEKKLCDAFVQNSGLLFRDPDDKNGTPMLKNAHGVCLH